jgi:hypothetical protein
LFKPFVECAEFHRVLDGRVSGQDSDCEILADVLNPTALADRPEPEHDGFIEASGSDFGAVLDSFGIADADAAGTSRHSGSVAYSLYILYIRYHRLLQVPAMRDIGYVVELANAYGRALITRDELQDEIHSCSLLTVELGVNAFAEEFGEDAAAAFVVAAELPIFYERLPAAYLATPEIASGLLPEGCWSIDRGDERVKDFPPG